MIIVIIGVSILALPLILGLIKDEEVVEVREETRHLD